MLGVNGLRCRNPRAKGDFRPCRHQRQFGQGDGRQAHAFVAIADMADAKHLARQWPKARPERGVVAIIGDADHIAGIHPFGRANGCDRVGVERGAFGTYL